MLDERLIPEIYSTDEVKTNEIYIDKNGKKWNIYQKMFVTSEKTFNTGTYELGTLDNTCLIMKWYPTFINNNNAQFQMSNPNTELYHQNGKISVNFKTNWGSGHIELIVKYRKISD